MKLTLYRKHLTNQTTIGELYVNGAFQCWTLEDVCRAPGVKIKGKTAIPAGVYEVVINYSARFKTLMPLLVNVPMFEGIRIHPGNTHEDTAGCILVGRNRITDAITDSRLAYNDLYKVLASAVTREKITIEILNPTGTEKVFTPHSTPQNAPEYIPTKDERIAAVTQITPVAAPQPLPQASMIERVRDALFGSGKIETQWASLALLAWPLWNELAETLVANGVQLPRTKGEWLTLLIAVGRLLVLRLKK